MELTLHYKGVVKSNASREEKQELRRAFHPQLQTLWKQPPLHLDKVPDLLSRTPGPGNISVIVERGGFAWAPLISSRLLVFAEIEMNWLRAGPPGNLLQSGDIDNRLKTIFDALQV